MPLRYAWEAWLDRWAEDAACQDTLLALPDESTEHEDELSSSLDACAAQPPAEVADDAPAPVAARLSLRPFRLPRFSHPSLPSLGKLSSLPLRPLAVVGIAVIIGLVLMGVGASAMYGYHAHHQRVLAQRAMLEQQQRQQAHQQQLAAWCRPQDKGFAYRQGADTATPQGVLAEMEKRYFEDRQASRVMELIAGGWTTETTVGYTLSRLPRDSVEWCTRVRQLPDQWWEVVVTWHTVTQPTEDTSWIAHYWVDEVPGQGLRIVGMRKENA